MDIPFTNRGFTLLEVLITLFIVAIGVLGLVGMQVTGIRGNAYSIEMTQAAVMGQEKIEELKNLDYGAMAGGNDTVTQAGVDYARIWTVTPIGGMSRVQVVVSWTDKSSTSRSTSVATLRTDL
jgi:type IV pilus assembly protein PilV